MCYNSGMKINESLITQMRKGPLEFCILALISREEMYGYQIINELSSRNGLVTSEGTVYPILSRLKEEGLVKTIWQESAKGHPRKYYYITDKGRRMLYLFKDQWDAFSTTVNQLLEECRL